MAIVASAIRYQEELTGLGRQVARTVLARWAHVSPNRISESWLAAMPDTAAALVAGQTVAAEMADPYLDSVLSRTSPPQVNPEALAGQTAGGYDVESLLYLSAIDTKEAIAAGSSPGAALLGSRGNLAMRMLSTVADAGRLSVTAGMAARPHVSGYYRRLNPPSCARCAILAGKWFRYNAGFARHPHCDCVHVPVQDADDSLQFDARKAIAEGKVTGLSHADTYSIVQLGANPAQVVNAHGGMYVAGGRSFTTTGTTRKGVAGARMLARDVDRALGRRSGGTYRNYTFDRDKAARYAEQFRRGKTFTRTTASGRTQNSAYRFTRSARPTPEQILADATSREDAVRLLTNYGYIL